MTKRRLASYGLNLVGVALLYAAITLVSKQHVVLRSSARDNLLFKPYQNGSKTPENQGFPGFYCI